MIPTSSKEMVYSGLLVLQLFLFHLLLSHIVLTLLGHVLHIVVHPHVLRLLHLVVLSSGFGILHITHVLLHLLLLSQQLALGILLPHLMSRESDTKVVVLVSDLVYISFLLELHIVGVEPGSISTS